MIRPVLKWRWRAGIREGSHRLHRDAGVTQTMDDLEFMASPIRIRDFKNIREGGQAELFCWSQGKVVKLFCSACEGASARLEAAVMHLLQSTGIPMPQIFGTAAIEHRPAIVMEHLVGTDQLSFLRSKPWTIWGAARNLAQLHVQFHSTRSGHVIVLVDSMGLWLSRRRHLSRPRNVLRANSGDRDARDGEKVHPEDAAMIPRRTRRAGPAAGSG